MGFRSPTVSGYSLPRLSFFHANATQPYLRMDGDDVMLTVGVGVILTVGVGVVSTVGGGEMLTVGSGVMLTVGGGV